MLSSAAEDKKTIIFHILPGMPYPVRILLSGALLISGITAQAYGALYPGVAAIFGGVLLLTTRGYHNTVKPARGGSAWQTVGVREVTRIVELNERQRRWDTDAVDITNGVGLLTFLAVAGGLGWWAWQAGGLESSLGRLVILDSVAALLPFWVTGVRSVLKNDVLVIKADLLLKLHAAHAAQPQPDEQFQFQMQTARVETGGTMPKDVKAMVRFSNGPADFYGLQIQIAINSVQGSDYPYAYCVLVAKPGFNLHDRLARLGVTPGPGWSAGNAVVVVEAENNDDAEVMIFRQETAGEGYRTKPRQAQAIFEFALSFARRLVQ